MTAGEKVDIGDKRSWLERALAVTPGASQTRSKAPGVVGPLTGFPLVATRADGAKVYTPDGKVFIDFCGANAACTLGYAHRRITSAILDAAQTGVLLPLPARDEAMVAEQLIEFVGFGEMVRFVKTGSEAMSAAVRLARAVTRRPIVLVADHSYHGWHDWFQGRTHPETNPCEHDVQVWRNGIPASVGESIAVYRYADPDHARVLIEMKRNEIAAVIIEPHRFMTDQRGIIEGLHAIARAAEIPVIHDETVFGFRWARGGGHEFFETSTPDLAVFGKAMGNGVPIAAVVGSRRWMEPAAEFISSTYGADRIGLLAACAVMQVYQRDEVIGGLWEVGRAFWQTFEATMDPIPGISGNVPVGRLEGFPVHFRFVSNVAGMDLDEVQRACARDGYLFHRSANNVNVAMTDEMVRTAATTLARAMNEAARVALAAA